MNPSFFFAEVVSVHDDEEMIGRAKIRILGDQDDRARLPNEELRWARPIMNSYDAPQYAGVGRGGTGLVPGSRVFGFFMDSDNQHPFILGTIPTAGRTNSPPAEQGTMPDGTPVAAGNPFGGRGPLVFHTQRNRLEGDASLRVEQIAPALQRLASNSIEGFFAAGAGNGPPRYGRETNILASIAPGGLVSDITGLIRRINPNNIGGMPGTLMSLSSLAGRLTGIPSQILGSAAFSSMSIVSSILNINSTNILGSLSTILGNSSQLLTLAGAGQLASTLQQVGQTAISLSQMTPTQLITGAISSLPLSPIQQFALNISTGAIASGNPAQLLNAATTIATTFVPGASQAVNDLTQIAGDITRIASLSQNTTLSLTSLVQASNLTSRILSIATQNNVLMNIFDSSQATPQQRDALEQIRALAYDAGHILNVGDRLVNLANNPPLLISELDRIINNTV
jgi:hypothetical protein